MHECTWTWTWACGCVAVSACGYLHVCVWIRASGCVCMCVCVCRDSGSIFPRTVVLLRAEDWHAHCCCSSRRARPVRRRPTLHYCAPSRHCLWRSPRGHAPMAAAVSWCRQRANVVSLLAETGGALGVSAARARVVVIASVPSVGAGALDDVLTMPLPWVAPLTPQLRHLHLTIRA